MARNVIYLVRTKINQHGNMVPENYDHCPIYIEEKIKGICFDGRNRCVGIDDKNICKDQGNMNFLLQCNFCLD